MNKKLSDKDKKDWQSFVENKDKVENKDLEKKKENIFFEKKIDLNGYTYNIGVSKINIITGKGSRSKVNDDPYKSANFGILKYSIPEFIKNDADLIKIIKEIDFDSINSENQGSFNITLKKK